MREGYVALLKNPARGPSEHGTYEHVVSVSAQATWAQWRAVYESFLGMRTEGLNNIHWIPRATRHQKTKKKLIKKKNWQLCSSGRVLKVIRDLTGVRHKLKLRLISALPHPALSLSKWLDGGAQTSQIS